MHYFKQKCVPISKVLYLVYFIEHYNNALTLQTNKTVKVNMRNNTINREP